jgi:hypothetical protein
MFRAFGSLWSLEGVALALATASLLWQIGKDLAERRQRKPRIRVRIVPTTIVAGDEPPRAEFHLHVENLGNESASIREVGLRLPDETAIRFPRVDVLEMPQSLAAGQQFSVGIPARDVADQAAASGYQGMVSLRAFCRDAGGAEYRSAEVAFDIARFETD